MYERAWYYGALTSYGMLQDPTGTWHFEDGRTLMFVPITINRSGRYRVRHYMQWEWLDGMHRQLGRVCRYV